MSYTGRTFEEKRNYIRMRVDCRVLYKEQMSDAQYEAKGKDLSGAGVLFETDRPLLQGQLLEISVLPDQKNIAPLDATVQVVRIVPVDNGEYEVGVRIQSMKN